MNRGDIKLMIDQLTCLDVGEADAEIVESVIAKLEVLGNEHAKLRDALKVCADQFEKYAEYHAEKMHRAESMREHLASFEKAESNQLLAANAREALKGIEK